MWDNSSYGLTVFSGSAYSDNVVTNNETGTVRGAESANNLDGNYCAGTGAVSVTRP